MEFWYALIGIVAIIVFFPYIRCFFKRLDAFESMIRFYEKQGFVTAVHREDWRLMQKELQ